MNNNLYIEYRERFGCRVTIAFQSGEMILSAPNGKLYSVNDATDEELNALMKESIDAERNVLLEKFKDKEYSFESQPEYDY